MGNSSSASAVLSESRAAVKAAPEASEELDAALFRHQRLCRAHGELVEAIQMLDELLDLRQKKVQENKDEDIHTQLSVAEIQYLLGNSLRLRLTPGSVFSLEGGLKERTEMLARAEDLLLRSLDVRLAAATLKPEDAAIARSIAKSYGGLAILQSAYGRFDEANANHLKSLETYASSIPLTNDDELLLDLDSYEWKNAQGVAFEDLKKSSSKKIRPISMEENDEIVQAAKAAKRPSITREKLLELLSEHKNNEERPEDLESALKSLRNETTKWRFVLQGDENDAVASFEIDAQVSETFVVSSLVHKGNFVVRLCTKKQAKAIKKNHAKLVIDDGGGGWRCVSWKGQVLLNGVRIKDALLKTGDLVEFGGQKAKMGSSAKGDYSKKHKKFAYRVEQVKPLTSTLVDLSVFGNSSSPGEELRNKAYAHFRMLSVSAVMSIKTDFESNSQGLTDEETKALFAAALEEQVPFNLWGAWIAAELAKTRAL